MVSANTLDALLPQTQCGECGYPGCMPYAQAMAAGLAPIDRCPPGGADTVKALGKLLDIDPSPYIDEAIANTRPPAVALIREAECIGCTKCIQACPVDAILGSGKLMHSVLADECTGCGLCIEPCPVDCIELVILPTPSYDKERARASFNARQIRLLRDEKEKQLAYRQKRTLVALTVGQQQDKIAKQDYILQALERANKKRVK